MLSRAARAAAAPVRRRHIGLACEWCYRFQPSARSRFQYNIPAEMNCPIPNMTAMCHAENSARDCEAITIEHRPVSKYQNPTAPAPRGSRRRECEYSQPKQHCPHTRHQPQRIGHIAEPGQTSTKRRLPARA